MIRRWILPVFLFICIAGIVPLQAQAVNWTPITTENAAQLRLLDTIPDYRGSGYCGCDAHYMSQDGHVIATEQKIRDLVMGKTYDLTGQGYPVAVSPDGSLVLIAGNGGGTRLVDVASGSESLLLTGNADAANFSPDGKLIAVTSRDADAVQVWDVASRTLIKSFANSSLISQPQFTPDGKVLVYLSDQSQIMRWEVGTNSDPQRLADAFDFWFAPDGTTVLIRSNSFSTTTVWDVETGQQIAQINDHHEYSGIQDIAVSTDRRRLAISYFGSNHRVELWDISTASPMLIQTIQTEMEPSVLFTPNSHTLLLTGNEHVQPCDHDATSCSSGGGGSNNQVEFIDANSGAEVGSPLSANKSLIYRTVISLDGKLLLTGSYFEGVILWHLDGTHADQIAQIPGDGTSFTLSPDGSTLLAELDDKLLGVYGIPSADRAARPFVLSASVVPNTVSLRAAPSSDAAIIGHASGSVRVLGRSGSYAYIPDQNGWVRDDSLYLRLIDGLPIDTLPDIDPAQAAHLLTAPITLTAAQPAATPEVTLAPAAPLDALKMPVNDPLIAPPAVPDGLTLITPDNAAQVDLVGVLPQSQIGTDTFPPRASAISTDGTHLLVPFDAANNAIRAWDLRTMTISNQLQVQGIDPTGGYNVIAIASPDSHTVAYSPDEYEHPLQVQSLDASQPQATIDSTGGYPYGFIVAFSPDGRTLAVPHGLFDVASGKVRATLDAVGDAFFSADSRRLALLTSERAYIIDVDTGKQIALTPREGGEYFTDEAMAFSPDDRLLAISRYGTVTLYDTATGNAVLSWASTQSTDETQTQIAFSPDGHEFVMLAPDGTFRVIDLQQKQEIGTYPLKGAKRFAFSPDGRLLAVSDPLQLIDLTTGAIIPMAGDYTAETLRFTPDGATLLADTATRWYDKLHTVMVFGVPTPQRPIWQSLSVKVVPSGITARSKPETSASQVGAVSGQITVSARNQDGTAAFVPSVNGWVWSAPAYLDLGSITLDMLPVRSGEK